MVLTRVHISLSFVVAFLTIFGVTIAADLMSVYTGCRWRVTSSIRQNVMGKWW